MVDEQDRLARNLLEESIQSAIGDASEGVLTKEIHQQDDKGLVQEQDHTLIRESYKSDGDKELENDLAIERIMADNTEMFGIKLEQDTDPLDRFANPASGSGYDYVISSDLNLDLATVNLDNLDLDIDFDAVLRGDANVFGPPQPLLEDAE